MVDESIVTRLLTPYRQYQELQNLQPSTISSYVKNIDYLIREGIFSSQSVMTTWFTAKKKSASNNRYNKLVSSLRSFVSWGKQQGHLPDWPNNVAYNILKPIARSRIKTVLDLFAYSGQQESDLLDACEGWTEKAIFWTPLKTGIRSRTVFGLELDDIVTDKEGYGIHVRPEIDKNHLYRFIPIEGEENRKFLDNYLRYRSLLGRSYDSKKFIILVDTRGNPVEFKGGIRSRMYERLTKRIKARVALHNCRYTYAWKVWQATGDIYLVQYLLGHKNVQQTVEYLKVQQHIMKAHVRKKMRGVIV